MANMRNVNLNLLLVFDALMREKNVSRAGDKIGLSQPGMSYSLKQLRNLFNDPLFLKTQQGMVPTDTAKHIYGHIKEALFIINEAIDYEYEFNPETADFNFRIGLSDYAAFILLPKVYKAISKLAPNVRLSIHNLNSPENAYLLEDDKIDLAISVYDKTPQKLECVELFREHFVCLYDNNVLGKKKITLKTFVQHPHLLIDFRADPPSSVTKALAKQSLVRQIAITIPYTTATGSIIQNSNLITVVPNQIAQSLSTQYNLATSTLPVKIPDSGVYLIWHKRYHNKPEQKWLREKIIRLWQP